MAENNVVYDVASYDIITKAIKNLLNQFPVLESDEEISFSVLGEDEGIAFFPISGAVIQSEIKDVTDHVEQTCAYPFIVYYKASGLSENGKLNAKEWLDKLGSWLERQIIDVDGTSYQLTEYPPLSGDREFLEIERTSPAYLMETTEDKVDSWAININAQYRNEFDLVG